MLGKDVLLQRICYKNVPNYSIEIFSAVLIYDKLILYIVIKGAMKLNYITLNNGVKMPQLGYGVFKVTHDEVKEAVTHALNAGYRSIDTAQYYENEAGVGEAIRESDIPREEIFVTTKVWNSHHGYDKTLEAFEQSLSLLGLDYIDLYLVHWPTPKFDLYVETYQALEKLYRDGRVKAIGVSNFHIEHLERILDECEIVPVVNQVECHPYLQQKELKQFCKQHNIALEAWSPLFKGGEVLQDTVIQEIAQKYNKTAAQVILRWHIQEDTIIIPKSVTPSRIQENIDVFHFFLTDEEMEKIAQLNRNERVGKDPNDMHAR